MYLNNNIISCREFEVPSLNFPDQKHKWRLSPLLQGGAARARETLDSDLALAARLLVITARERIWGSFFSIKEALKAMGRGLLKLLDLIFGRRFFYCFKYIFIFNETVIE